MNEEPNLDERMVRYWLGTLPEEEMARIEERYFADGEFYERLRAVEQDLVDEYARGELSPADRERFERRLLASPERRERVENARALATAPVIASAPEAAESRHTPELRGRAPAGPSAARGSPLRYALAAALALAALAAAWVYLAGRSEPAAVPPHEEPQLAQQPAPERPPAAEPPEPQPSPPTRQENDNQPPQSPAGPTAPALPRGEVLAFSLPPGGIRGETEMRTVAIPPGTERVRIRLQLGKDTYPSYRASVETPDGRSIWTASGLRPVKGRSPSVVVSVPARLLREGAYVVALTGVTAGGGIEEAEDYFFAVEPGPPAGRP